MGKRKQTDYRGKKGDSYLTNAWQDCGHCIECMNKKANNWLVRNKYEDKTHKKKCFITLTYKNNPRILVKRDIQLFMKRLRYYLEQFDIRIRYYGCGEYGTLRSRRPHYHFILYGWIPPDIEFARFSKRKHKIYESEFITTVWGKGITSVQAAKSKTIPYMALYQSPNLENRKKKYILKDQLLKMYETDMHAYEQWSERLEKTKSKVYEIKEFNFYSQGIGFENYLKEYDKASTDFMEVVGDGEYGQPTPWIKRMAEYGEVRAIEEMKKRTEIAKQRHETIAERTVEKMYKARKKNDKEVLKKEDIQLNFF